MRFSREDIAQQRFQVKLRGYSQEQVREFLSVLAGDMSDIVTENRRLNRENEQLTREVAEFRRRERSLHDALELAKSTAEEVKERARRDAEVIVAEAELAAERKYAAAARAIDQAKQELRELMEKRRRVTSEMRATLEMHLHLIDSQREPEYLSEAEDEEDDRGDTLPGIHV